MLLALAIIVPAAVFATNVPEPDECGESATYTFSSNDHGNFGDDFSKPANVDFTNTGAPGEPDKITVTADAGFVITKVELSVDDDNQSGFVNYPVPVTDLNPAGTEINVAKVTVKKVCPDLCANIEGDQYTVPEGMILEGDQCVVPPPPDACPNLEGNQEEVPDGYHLEEGQCIENPPDPIDMCPNIEGDQETVPEGYEIVEGQCVELPPPPTDVCENIDGLQEEIPEGYESLSEGQCTLIPPPPVDVCKNLDGLQESVPEGYESLSEGQCTEIPDVPADVCPNIEGDQASVPEGYELDSESQCVPVTQEPTDVCPNLEGDQASVPEGYHSEDGQCIEDEDDNGGGGGGGSHRRNNDNDKPEGEIAGSEISCGYLLFDHLRMGWTNNPTSVMILQTFLNLELGTALPIDGVFGEATDQAVRAFQLKYPDQVLTPWGLTDSTGFVYLTTLRWINMVHCPALNIPVPSPLNAYGSGK